jgi:ankyrin repeat protein
LDNDADVNAKNDSGETSLHVASKEGNEAIVSFLLDSGANIHAKDKDGRTPLHEASRYGQESVVS